MRTRGPHRHTDRQIGYLRGMAFVDELTDWTDYDGAAAALGRTLGVFPDGSTLADVKAVLWTNSAAGNSLYGMLARLAWLGVLEHDEEAQRYRAAHATLHPLGERDDVPSLAAGPPSAAQIHLGSEPDGVCLTADRAGYRYLARVFDEIANSAADSRGGKTRFACPTASGSALGVTDAALALVLVDPEADPEPT
jgi:hypothetical protein